MKRSINDDAGMDRVNPDGYARFGSVLLSNVKLVRATPT